MEFVVPQFIERETKVIGPFTFKQFIFVGIAGGFLMVLFFFLPFSLFIVATIFLMGGALLLAFFKKGGTPLSTIIKNAFIFLRRPRVYLWKKKAIPPKIFEKPEEATKEEEEEEKEGGGPVLKVAEKSRLGKLFTFLETRTK